MATSVSPLLSLSCLAQPCRGTLPDSHGSWRSSPSHLQSHSSTAHKIREIIWDIFLPLCVCLCGLNAINHMNRGNALHEAGMSSRAVVLESYKFCHIEP